MLGLQRQQFGNRVMPALGWRSLLGEWIGHAAGEHRLLGALAASVVGYAVHSMRQATMNAVNDLVREAMLHPDLARALTERAAPRQGTAPIIQRRIGAAI